MSDFSFLCTFVPGSEKSTDGTFVAILVQMTLNDPLSEISMARHYSALNVSETVPDNA